MKTATESPLQLISAMQRQTTEFRRTVIARDFRELVACAVVAIIFGYFCFSLDRRDPISQVGDLLVVASCVFIGWKMVHARLSAPPAPAGATVVEALRAELQSVRTQSELLRSIFWWYLLPPTIGALIATWGRSTAIGGKIATTLVILAVDALVYWLNQWGRSKQLLPVEAQLESLVHSAETGEPLDEKNVARLRPIALSMAAADQVKPVEFGVAFWQIALFAEIGFVGMWFFFTLSQVIDNQNWKTKETSAAKFAQKLGVLEINRYQVVAQEVVDLLKAGDHTGVQHLYNAGMSKAFPPNETSAVYTRLASRWGKIESFEGPIGSGYRGWPAFRLHCERGELIMSMALDPNDRISGIYFGSTARAFLNPLSPARGGFIWSRLIWIVPFFLAGLLFAWILKKTTERAVGISSLGIHLNRGLVLILWDEIKEVRTFRLLHIRSLWLVKESGEKMITPWSSLERHSELKEAVGRFAPANHPIKEYLGLLKRG